jgi:hypothetical protein
MRALSEDRVHARRDGVARGGGAALISAGRHLGRGQPEVSAHPLAGCADLCLRLRRDLREIARRLNECSDRGIGAGVRIEGCAHGAAG